MSDGRHGDDNPRPPLDIQAAGAAGMVGGDDDHVGGELMGREAPCQRGAGGVRNVRDLAGEGSTQYVPAHQLGLRCVLFVVAAPQRSPMDLPDMCQMPKVTNLATFLAYRPRCPAVLFLLSFFLCLLNFSRATEIVLPPNTGTRACFLRLGYQGIGNHCNDICRINNPDRTCFCCTAPGRRASTSMYYCGYLDQETS